MTPCKHCGTPIEQRPGRGRPRSYCAQGDCQAAAKRERELRRATPGLEGTLARAEEFYERMEKGMASVIEPLARVLAEELSPAGVEAKLSAMQAEAHTRVAIARTEREQAFEQVRLAREATEHARRERDDMARQMEEANAERDTALADAETAREQALAALREASATERRARNAEAEARHRAEQAEAARDAAVRELAERVEATERSAAEQVRAARDQAAELVAAAERRAEEAHAQAEELRRDSVQALAERDKTVMDLALAQARTADLRQQIEALRAESARLLERAVSAELRAGGAQGLQ
ncbi:hypothetical protein Psi01_81170 [Planobispora siamensis]|uniref:Uncharacterized protein n=1 Tax=Planobispora siamensis TaxID=936338 RepID=A0A8J3WQY8_9ACTN|nr:hypothetical protein Psi01_81170 [Planobispora siamensis]